MEPAASMKQTLRDTLTVPLAGKNPASMLPGMGQAAERLRRLTTYQEARHILCSPVSNLFQARLNALLDGKLLTVATPGLTKGFVRLDPGTIPPNRRFQSARLFPEALKGMNVPYDRPVQPPIDLVVADALAADVEGHLLGDGLGHLDLQVAILCTLNWLCPKAHLVAVVGEKAILPTIPWEETDVCAHWIVTPSRVVRSPISEPPRAVIRWEKLGARKIRRNSALFHLSRSLVSGLD